MNAATITLTADQVASIMAQQGGAQPPQNPIPPQNPGQPNPGKPPEPATGNDRRDIPLAWNSGGERVKTRDYGGFPQGGSVAFGPFRTGPASTRGATKISASEFDSFPSMHRAVIAEAPGSFDPVTYKGIPCLSVGRGSVSITVYVGESPDPYTPALKPDTPYWFNIKEEDEPSGEMQAYISNPS